MVVEVIKQTRGGKATMKHRSADRSINAEQNAEAPVPIHDETDQTGRNVELSHRGNGELHGLGAILHGRSLVAVACPMAHVNLR